MNYKINKYPDGTSYITISKVESRFPKVTFKINSYENLWQLGQLVEVCKSNNLEPTITIPNLIDAQADRRFEINQSSGLKQVCGFLNSMGVKFKIFHPHNPEVVEALIDNVEIINNNDFISVVIETITDEEDSYKSMLDLNENLILMSSDAGGFKPLSKLCDSLNWKGEMYSAAKARSWDEKDGTKFVQQVDRKDFEGKDILIIDDISVYGGTFKGLSKILRSKNCGKLYLAVSHMTMQNLGNNPVTNYFDKVFTTDSKYFNYDALMPRKNQSDKHYNPENLEVIKMFDI